MKRHKIKKNAKEVRSTIKELHYNKLNEIDEIEKTLPEKEKKLKKLKLKYIKSKNKLKQNKIQEEEVNLLFEDINNLEKEIKDIKEQNNLTEYLLDVHSVFKQKAIIENDNNIEKTEKTENEKSEKSEENKKSEEITVTDFIISTSSNHKKKLLNEYLRLTGKAPDEEIFEYNRDEFMCKTCKTENMIVDPVRSMLVCRDCGLGFDWQNPYHPQWSDNTKVTQRYRYKRKNYFIDHLNRFQGKENITIPKELLQQIIDELDKNRVSDPKNITPKLIKSILRHINQSSYYDNINSIISKLTGKTPPKLTPELERRLLSMFEQTNEPFDKWKHLIKNRNNYLSYPYTIRKLLEIISIQDDDEEIRQMSLMFKLPKSSEKLTEQEKVFEKICLELEWPFRKTSFHSNNIKRFEDFY